MARDARAVKSLNKKIADLELRADEQGLSIHNNRHLAFLRMWRDFAKDSPDVVLVFQPVGALRLADDDQPVKIVECKADVAADKIVFAAMRDERVRLATPEEIAQYRAHNAKQREAAQQTIAAHQARVAQQGLQALLGTAVSAGAAPQTARPEAPVIDFGGPDPDDANLGAIDASLEPDDLGPAVARGHEADPDDPGKREAPATTAETGATSALDPRFGDIGTANQVKALLAAGWSDLEKISETDPAELAKAVPGVSPAGAAKIVVAAAELLGEGGDGDDSTSETAGDGEGAPAGGAP